MLQNNLGASKYNQQPAGRHERVNSNSSFKESIQKFVGNLAGSFNYVEKVPKTSRDIVKNLVVTNNIQ